MDSKQAAENHRWVQSASKTTRCVCVTHHVFNALPTCDSGTSPALPMCQCVCANLHVCCGEGYCWLMMECRQPPVASNSHKLASQLSHNT
jgi:hypothetical protein